MSNYLPSISGHTLSYSFVVPEQSEREEFMLRHIKLLNTVSRLFKDPQNEKLYAQVVSGIADWDNEKYLYPEFSIEYLKDTIYGSLGVPPRMMGQITIGISGIC